MTGKKGIEVTKTITEKEIFERIDKIPNLETKIDKILLLLEGDPEKKIICIDERTRQTNGKVKFHTKALYALWSVVVFIAIFLVTKALTNIFDKI